MYCFILLFNLFNSLMTDFTVTGSGTLILCNIQLTMLERFSAILAMYMVLYSKYENKFFEKNQKSDLSKKILFFYFYFENNHDFSDPACFIHVICQIPWSVSSPTIGLCHLQLRGEIVDHC